MNLFETVFFDCILIVFPLMLYLIYSIYTKTLSIERNNLFLDCALFSTVYLLIKFGKLSYSGIPLLIFDIPLILAYLKHRHLSITLITLAIVLYYNRYLNISFYILVIEYTGYFLLYILINKKTMLFMNIYTIVKIVMFSVYLNISPIYSINNDTLVRFLILMFYFFIITNFIIYLYNHLDDVICLYENINDIEKEKSLKKSLFKITHEIKNPIAVCKGYLDMFDVENKEHSRKYIPIIKSEIDRVLYLLEDFLSITKIKIEKEEMDLNMLLEDTVSCLKPILDNKNINFISYITDDEIYIDADYNRLKQTLVNLIKNSRESIKSDGTIKLYTNKSNKKVRIYVEDSGIGMSKEELSKIKEAFFTTKSRGTGLGVFLANEIITSHGGTLEYKSKKNKGTKVIITLPV